MPNTPPPNLLPHHVQRLTDSAKVFWGAVTLAVAIASGGFVAGAQFVALKTEFRDQMAQMLTVKAFNEGKAALKAEVRAELLASLQRDPWQWQCPRWPTKDRPSPTCKLVSVGDK